MSQEEDFRVLLDWLKGLTGQGDKGNRKIFFDLSRFRELFSFFHVCAVSPLDPHLPPQPGGDPIPEASVHDSVNGGLKVFKACLFPAGREKFSRLAFLQARLTHKIHMYFSILYEKSAVHAPRLRRFRELSCRGWRWFVELD
ncbi:hypothetical protein [Novosphingobium pentaromativorans]|uniref:hypothetical protein n=1 Tax=Novosphingobium pentaromativorans TaxID=205844 RepID=UPI00110FDF91|nr:hypothetical protein [Novosphingobium pentaromativorans]